MKKYTMDIYDVVKKLTGPISPAGETHLDVDRYENLQEVTELVERLLADIKDVALNKTRQEASMKKAGEYAAEFLDNIEEEK